jgi:Protein of unknown function (DUF1682)
MQNEDKFILTIDFLASDPLCPFVYAILHNRVSKSFLAMTPDVRAFTKQMPLESLPKTLVCMTENRDCVILTTRLIQALRQNEDSLRYLHISDQIDLTDIDPPDRGIRLCCLLPQVEEDAESFQELILAVCDLTDVVCTDAIFPTIEARESAIAARMRVRDILAREDQGETGGSLRVDVIKKNE